MRPIFDRLDHQPTELHPLIECRIKCPGQERALLLVKSYQLRHSRDEPRRVESKTREGDDSDPIAAQLGLLHLLEFFIEVRKPLPLVVVR